MIDYSLSIDAPDQSAFKVINGKYIACGDALQVYYLDDTLIPYLKGDGNGKYNSITIYHIPIETGAEEYYKNLCELIKYIIYYQQNDIVNDGLFILNRNDQFDTLARKAVNACQKKITKRDYELFPIESKACFKKDLSELCFTVSDPNDTNQSYFANEITKESVKVNDDPEPEGVDCINEEPYKSDDFYYEPVPGHENGVPKDQLDPLYPTSVLIQYQRTWMKETYTVHIRGMYSTMMGSITNCVYQGSLSITITRKVPYDKYLVVK